MKHTLQALFAQKKQRVLNMYFTAGYPKLESTTEVLLSLQEAGADIIEVGIPYSDPIADGPVIQASNMQAIENGISIEKVFEQLESIQQEIKIPVILMGYLNPVMQYGFEAFCSRAASVGVAALILPDIPLDIFEKEYKAILKKYSLDLIWLITPQTSEARIKKIDKLSKGFVYAVSSSSVTGTGNTNVGQDDYFKRLQSMKLKSPILIGFGIKDKTSFDNASKYGHGAIIGSAYINAIKDSEHIKDDTANFIQSILN